MLGDAITEQKKAELETELEARRQALLNTGGGAAVAGSVHTEGGDFVGRDKNIHYHGEDPANAEQAEAIYRREVAERCGRLPLRGVEPAPGEGPATRKHLSLARVYITLDTKQSATASAITTDLTDAAQGNLKGLSNTPSRGDAGREEEMRPVSALEAAILHRH